MNENQEIFYMAPMLGITDSCFRTAFMNSFGGFDLGISPFIRTLQGQRYKDSKVLDLDLKYNIKLPIHPQILTNQADDFIALAEDLFELGHPTINLNMGCPVPTAAGRGRGAGLLPELELVDKLLETVLNTIPNRLSIKTRIGFEDEGDLLRMADVFNRYPLVEVIIHPRTASQKYGGDVNHQAFDLACEALKHEVVYSGDIFSVESFQEIRSKHPKIKKWMIGRGILLDPRLIQRITKKPLATSATLVRFYQELIELYRKRDLSEHIILRRIKCLMAYLGEGFKFDKKALKALQKSPSNEILIEHLVAIVQSY